LRARWAPIMRQAEAGFGILNLCLHRATAMHMVPFANRDGI